MDARVRLQRAWNGAVDNLIQLKGTGISINLSSCVIPFSRCHQFNNFAAKFTILLLRVRDILLSISMSSLDLPLHSLALFGTESITQLLHHRVRQWEALDAVFQSFNNINTQLKKANLKKYIYSISNTTANQLIIFRPSKYLFSKKALMCST